MNKYLSIAAAALMITAFVVPAMGASISVQQMPDTPKSQRLSRADMLANKGFYPPVCGERQKVCTITGLGGEVWIWEGYAKAMLYQGKTLLFKGKCMSACYLAYLAAKDWRDSNGNPGDVRVAKGTKFYRHTPYTLKQ